MTSNFTAPNIIALAAVLISAALTLIAWAQARSAKDSATHSKTSADAAAAQVVLMTAQLDVMKRQLALEEEALTDADRSLVVPVSRLLFHQGYSSPIGSYLTLKNQGQKPLHIVSVLTNGTGNPKSFLNLAFESLPEPQEYLDPGQEGVIVLAVRNQMSADFLSTKSPFGNSSHVDVVFKGLTSTQQFELNIEIGVTPDGIISIQGWQTRDL